MSDKERLISLFSEFGIGYTLGEDSDWESKDNAVLIHNDEWKDEPNAKVEGYYGFYAQFNFDSAGKFVNVGIWE